MTTFSFTVAHWDLPFYFIQPGFLHHPHRHHRKMRKQNSERAAMIQHKSQILRCLFFNTWATLPETNMAPENGWLEYSFPFGMAYFQGLC